MIVVNKTIFYKLFIQGSELLRFSNTFFNHLYIYIINKKTQRVRISKEENIILFEDMKFHSELQNWKTKFVSFLHAPYLSHCFYISNPYIRHDVSKYFLVIYDVVFCSMKTIFISSFLFVIFNKRDKSFNF